MLTLRDEVNSTLFITLKYELFLELLPTRRKKKNSNCQLFHHFYQYIWLPPALVPTVAPVPDFDLLSPRAVTSHTSIYPVDLLFERIYNGGINRRWNNQREKDIKRVWQVSWRPPEDSERRKHMSARELRCSSFNAPDLPTSTCYLLRFRISASSHVCMCVRGEGEGKFCSLDMQSLNKSSSRGLVVRGGEGGDGRVGGGGVEGE